jgi:tetratricopeptide (TPR) repeat protein
MGDPSTSFETILAQCALALELEPDLADAHAAKGLALFTAGRAAEAEAELDRAMTLAPDSFEAYFFAGRCQRARGDHARAAVLFERAAELQPDDFRALGLAAQCYRSLGRDEPAQAAARRCLERIEGELAIHADDAKALAFGGAILVDLGQAERALNWAERAAASSRRPHHQLQPRLRLDRARPADEALARLESSSRSTTPGSCIDWMKRQGSRPAARSSALSGAGPPPRRRLYLGPSAHP